MLDKIGQWVRRQGVYSVKGWSKTLRTVGEKAGQSIGRRGKLGQITLLTLKEEKDIRHVRESVLKLGYLLLQGLRSKS